MIRLKALVAGVLVLIGTNFVTGALFLFAYSAFAGVQLVRVVDAASTKSWAGVIVFGSVLGSQFAGGYVAGRVAGSRELRHGLGTGLIVAVIWFLVASGQELPFGAIAWMTFLWMAVPSLGALAARQRRLAQQQGAGELSGS